MPNVIIDKSQDFAVRIVNLYKYLKYEKKEYDLSRQLLRSGTSIGANVSEAHNAQSNADFVAKMHIALKECNESRYWIRVLRRSNFLDERQYNSIMSDADEIYAILTAIIKKMKVKLSKG